MNNIFRTFGLILLFLIFWYLFFFVLSFIYSDVPTGKFNDNTTIFRTQGTQAVLGPWKRPALGTRIFFLGASNVGAAFNLYVLQKLSPNYMSYNLAGGDANFTYMQDAFNIVQIVGKSLKGSYVVIGIWYGSFSEDSKLLGEGSITSIRSEALRYGLYKLSGNRIELAVDRKWMPLAITLLRPFLLCQSVMVDAWEKYHDFCDFAHNGFKANLLDKTNAYDQKYRQAALQEFSRRYGDARQYSYEEQGQKFEDLCKNVVASGANLIIVDMPLPQWHRDGSALYRQYLTKKSGYIRDALKLPGVKYLDFSSNLLDSDFYDGTHPAESGAWQISKELLQMIKSQY